MAALFRSLFQKSVFPSNIRNITLSPISRIKEIKETKVGNTLTIEASIVPQKHENLLLKGAKNGACPICSTNLQVKHTDVLILSQFVRPNNTILPQRITGLCKVQQKRISMMILMAQKAGLMPTPRVTSGPMKRENWQKYNTYYDERTIQSAYFNNMHRKQYFRKMLKGLVQ